MAILDYRLSDRTGIRVDAAIAGKESGADYDDCYRIRDDRLRRRVDAGGGVGFSNETDYARIC